MKKTYNFTVIRAAISLGIILALILFALTSCSSDDTTIQEQSSSEYKNTLPKDLIGDYGTNRKDAEPGTLKITADSIYIITDSRTVAVRIKDYQNSQSFANDIPCWWIIRIGNIEYMIGAPKNNAVWVKYIDYNSNNWKSYNIGTYYKDFKPAQPTEPIEEQTPIFN